MEIINDLYVKATSPGVTWNITAPTGVSLVDHYAGFPNILIEAGNKMYYNTKMAMPNFYIVGELASNVLESLPQFKSNGAIDPKLWGSNLVSLLKNIGNCVQNLISLVAGNGVNSGKLLRAFAY